MDWSTQVTLCCVIITDLMFKNKYKLMLEINNSGSDKLCVYDWVCKKSLNSSEGDFIRGVSLFSPSWYDRFILTIIIIFH